MIEQGESRFVANKNGAGIVPGIRKKISLLQHYALTLAGKGLARKNEVNNNNNE